MPMSTAVVPDAICIVMSRSLPEKSPDSVASTSPSRRRRGGDLLEVHDQRICGQCRDEGFRVRTAGIGRRRLLGRGRLAGRRDGRWRRLARERRRDDRRRPGSFAGSRRGRRATARGERRGEEQHRQEQGAWGHPGHHARTSHRARCLERAMTRRRMLTACRPWIAAGSDRSTRPSASGSSPSTRARRRCSSGPRPRSSTASR